MRECIDFLQIEYGLSKNELEIKYLELIYKSRKLGHPIDIIKSAYNYLIDNYKTYLEISRKYLGKIFREYKEINYIHLVIKNYNLALARCNKILEKTPNYTDILHKKGTILEDLGKYQEAIDIYTKIINIDDKYLLAYNGIGRCYEKIGQPSRANQDLKEKIYNFLRVFLKKNQKQESRTNQGRKKKIYTNDFAKYPDKTIYYRLRLVTSLLREIEFKEKIDMSSIGPIVSDYSVNRGR